MKIISKPLILKKYLFQMFYESLIDEEITAEEVFENFWLIDRKNQDEENILSESDKEEVFSILNSAFNDRDANIKILDKYLKDSWSFERLPKTDQSILLVALAHMFYSSDIETKDFIQDYLELSKIFCEYKSLPFIISILNNIALDFNIGDANV